jgi:hypothetical protein
MCFRIRVLLALLCALGAVSITVGMIAALGETVWQDDGVPLCGASDDQSDPQLVSDGSGGAIVAWKDFRPGSSYDPGSNYDVYAQRVDGDGQVMWATGGVTITIASEDQLDVQLASDGSGGAIITWEDWRHSGSTGVDIYAQRVDGDGNVLWQTNGVILCAISRTQTDPQIISDGHGGAIVTWADARDLGSTGYDIYAQHIHHDGALGWYDGVSVCVATNAQMYPQIASDGQEGAIVTWVDFRGSDQDIYAQRVDDECHSLWQADGVSLCTASYDQFECQIVSDGSGGAIVTWKDLRSNIDADIYTQRVDGDGNVLWQSNGISLCLASGSQDQPQIVSDGSGGAIVVWRDNRDFLEDIYAQRVDSDGNVLWTEDGVSVCAASQGQLNPQIAADGAGGAIVTWRDARDFGSTSYDIYAQRLDGDGNVLWQIDGISLCWASNDQLDPQLVSDGYWGAIVTWTDERGSDQNIYAQRVGGVAEVSLPLVAKNQ